MITEADAIRNHARARPDHTALIFKNERLSYRELDRRSNQVANGLLSLGAVRQRRIGVITKNSAEYFENFFGIVKAGGVVLPVNWRLAAAEIGFVLRDAEVEILFIDTAFQALEPLLRADVPALRKIILLGSSDADRGFAAWRAAQSTIDPAVSVGSEEVMVQFYTSGTTGQPKGVQITHRSSQTMRAIEVEADEAWMQWGPQDVSIVALPSFHLSGTSWALQWLARGATCVVHEQVDPGAFLEAIEQHRVTHLFAVPAVIAAMLDHPRIAGVDFSSLKLVFYGGAPIPLPLLERALQVFNCGFVQIYGMTETNGVVCYLTPADHLRPESAVRLSCGRPLPSIAVRIMDKAGHELAPGEIGEICVRTPAIMQGYWKRGSEELAWGDYYRTGDGGYLNAEGYLFLVDRVKDMIVSGGENIYPAEIEQVLVRHPLIAEVAVIGVPDKRWGEAVTAIVVRRATADLGEADVIAFSKQHIAGYKAPKAVHFVAALPRNASGKILKRELRAQYAPIERAEQT